MTNQPEQRSDAWFKQRIGKVTGSNVGAILGYNPYKTAEDVLREMVRTYHGAEREFKGNIATGWGTHNEASAQLDYEMETGNSITECGFCEYNEWLGASPDGLVVDCNAVIEIKCPFGQRDKNPPQFKTAAEQPHYYAQMQIEMLATGTDACHFYQWSPHGTRLEIVQRDDGYIDDAVKELKAFHAWYLSELDNSAHLEPKLKEVNTHRAQQLVTEYHELGEAMEAAKHRQQEIMADLVRIAGERDSVVAGHKLTKVKRQGSVSYAKVVKEHAPDVDLEQYRGKPSEYWKLTRSV